MIKSQQTQKAGLKNTKGNKIRRIKKALVSSPDNQTLKDRLRYWHDR